MIEIFDANPSVAVQEAEYIRLLGYPRGRELSGRARELADAARHWYACHGRPWVYARTAERVELESDVVRLDKRRFSSPRLRRTLAEADAHAAVMVAVTAGAELEQEAQRLWSEEKPDEYFFLEVFGSAVVEHLVTTTGARLCAWAEANAAAVLPHDSPGYPDWDVAEQPRLLQLIADRWPQRLARHIDAFETGMLRPKKSLLAVFGVTRQRDRVGQLTDLNPCEGCSFGPCEYRRAPYRRAAALAPRELAPAAETSEEETEGEPSLTPLDPDARYATNRKALARWAADRLVLDRRADGSIVATFRYEGTTCTNMGRPLAYEYRVTLGRSRNGYVIESHSCDPAPGDAGHAEQCEYIKAPEELENAIAADAPLLGQPLSAVLSWRRAVSAAGCYCAPESRLHKWGLVLETLHYALAQAERP